MNLFDQIMERLRSLIIRRPQDTEAEIQGLIEHQKKQQLQLKESLTELIFQRKRQEQLLVQLEGQKQQLDQDLQLSVQRDMDELSIHLMDQQEQVEIEIKEGNENLKFLIAEIKSAREADLDLSRDLKKAESQLAVYNSRYRALQLKNSLRQQISQIHRKEERAGTGLSRIQESLIRLEARLENQPHFENDLDRQLKSLRKDKVDYQRKAQLEDLKLKLGQKKLSGRVITPQLVSQS
jgi:chromosome segregation ATPase